MISKKSVVLLLIFAAVATATGWFLVREARKTGESLDKIGFDPVQIPKKPVSDTEFLDTSKWKTYRNEEYGFELKYPENLVLSENGEGSVVGLYLGFSDENNQSVRANNVQAPNSFMAVTIANKSSLQDKLHGVKCFSNEHDVPKNIDVKNEYVCKNLKGDYENYFRKFDFSELTVQEGYLITHFTSGNGIDIYAETKKYAFHAVGFFEYPNVKTVALGVALTFKEL